MYAFNEVVIAVQNPIEVAIDTNGDATFIKYSDGFTVGTNGVEPFIKYSDGFTDQK